MWSCLPFAITSFLSTLVSRNSGMVTMSTKVNNCCSMELLKPPRKNKRRSHQTEPWSATSWRPVQTKRCPRPWRRRRRRCWRGSKRKFRSESSSRRSFHFFSVGPFSFLDRELVVTFAKLVHCCWPSFSQSLVQRSRIIVFEAVVVVAVAVVT